MAKVSVVIPVFNAEKYIGQCIESLINQTFCDIEIICVDDGSKDESLKIIKSYQINDSRIKIVQQKNLYAGVARNNGMKIAEGEYVIFLDADDFFDLTMIEKMFKKSKKTNSDICFCDADYYRDDLSCFQKEEHFLRLDLLPDKPVFSYQDMKDDIYQISPPCPFMMIKKTFIKEKQLCFEGTKKGNDLRFWGISIAAAKRITVVGEKLLHYRTGHTGHLQSLKNSNQMTEQHSLEQIKSFLEDEEMYSDVKRSFKDLVIGNNCHIMFNVTNKTLYGTCFDIIVKNNTIVKYDWSEKEFLGDIKYRRMCILSENRKYGFYINFFWFKKARLREWMLKKEMKKERKNAIV